MFCLVPFYMKGARQAIQIILLILSEFSVLAFYDHSRWAEVEFLDRIDRIYWIFLFITSQTEVMNRNPLTRKTTFLFLDKIYKI